MDREIKVMIVDDHDMVRVGLRTYLLLEDQITIIGEASNGQDALQQLQAMSADERPDVILMDMMMPIMDGVQTTGEVAKLYPNIKVIILTSFLEEEKVVHAIEAGAISYVLKTISSEHLIPVIVGAFNGTPVMNPEISMALTSGLRKRTLQGEEEQFTQREREVLLLIAEGKTNKDIGDELHISIKTVKTHVSNLLMKCELEDRTQLAIYAHRKGWV